MSKNHLEYRGYTGCVFFSEEDAVFHGKVMGIKSLITFEGESVLNLLDDFHTAIDEYLDHCQSVGRTPEKPYKGSFNVRVGVDLHRQAALLAADKGISLNTLIEEALRRVVGE